MFGIGTGELILILVIAMMVVGPEKLASFAGRLGRLVAKLRAETDSVTKEFREALSVDELKKEFEQAQQEATSIATEISTLNLAGIYDDKTAASQTPATPVPSAGHAAELLRPAPAKPAPLPNLSADAEAVELQAGALVPADEDVAPTDIAQLVVMTEPSPAGEPADPPNKG